LRFWNHYRLAWLLGIALLVWSLTLQTGFSLDRNARPLNNSKPETLPSLPPAQVHPLPPSLAQWQDPTNSGDYFDQITPSPGGYLVWSQLPIQVYIEPLPTTTTGVAEAQRWFDAVTQGVQAWQPYLPLTIVNDSETADIQIWRSAPPIQRQPDGTLGRIRAAETRYEFYLDSSFPGPPRLSHRCMISLSPHQAATYTQATARHELGHALGIWGHSLNPEDVMYFSQVRQPPTLSPRDINTLKRIYAQPTRLGWPLPEPRD